MSSKATPSKKDLRAAAKKHTKATNYIAEVIPSASDSYTVFFSVFLAAVSSWASQLSLSPVFGEIPSGLYHNQLKNTAFLAAASIALALKYTIPQSRILLRLSRFLIPLVAVNIPIAQGFIWQYAESLGATKGPIVTELATIGLLIVVTVFSITGVIRPVGVPTQNVAAADAVLLGGSWLLFTLVESGAQKYLGSWVGFGWPMTRCGMEATAAIFSMSLHRSIFLISAVPSLFPIFYADQRCLMGTKGLKTLNQQLDPLNFTAITRIESNTGYLSVLENNVDGYRILRCDHSILGGVWTKPPPGIDPVVQPEYLKEPIYAVFTMLEAIRLVDPPAKERKDPNALVIGLGIGTSAAGLIHHGVKTHIVEIDPGVYKIAKEQFGLPMNHSVHIGDAVSYIVNEYAKANFDHKEVEKYDYIVHDVFTGGAVPADLFTWEFLTGVMAFLKPNGVIAINYAGDLKLKASLSVIHTIISVFGTCRAYREYAPPEDKNAVDDFTNMVIYCTPFHKARKNHREPSHLHLTADQSPPSPYFHKPEEVDYLNTWVRRQKMFPEFEVDLENIRAMGKKGELDSISVSTVGKLKEWQKESAVLHWGIMNTVIPTDVWTLY